MIVHDSDKIQITEETDGTMFMAVDTGEDTTVIEVSERELEDLFDNLVDYFANKTANNIIDSDLLEEMQDDTDNVLRLR